jgi:hypothetical protein
MNPPHCPNCGGPTADEAPTCPACGCAVNGKAAPGDRPPSIPDGRLPPEWDAWERQAFDKDAFLAGLREVERTGGVELKDFIHEIDRGEESRE